MYSHFSEMKRESMILEFIVGFNGECVKEVFSGTQDLVIVITQTVRYNR